MKITEDPETGDIYAEFSPAERDRQVQLSPSVIVDLDADDQVVGVEVLVSRGVTVS